MCSVRYCCYNFCFVSFREVRSRLTRAARRVRWRDMNTRSANVDSGCLVVFTTHGVRRHQLQQPGWWSFDIRVAANDHRLRGMAFCAGRTGRAANLNPEQHGRVVHPVGSSGFSALSPPSHHSAAFTNHDRPLDPPLGFWHSASDFWTLGSLLDCRGRGVILLPWRLRCSKAAH